MRAYTFIGGRLFNQIRLDISDPPMLLLGKADIYAGSIIGDCAAVLIDVDDPPIFIDGTRRSFSHASYGLRPSDGHNVCSLEQDCDFPDDRVLVRINTRGLNKSILGRFEILRGDPFCLARGFGADGTTLFRCRQLEAREPPIVIFSGKWNEGLFLFSPGDVMRVIPQCPRSTEYRLEYTKLYGLEQHSLLVSPMSA